jgi:hypothetical protein
MHNNDPTPQGVENRNILVFDWLISKKKFSSETA